MSIKRIVKIIMVITILISINSGIAGNTEDYDFYCNLSYHPYPFTMKEWEIEIYRKGRINKIATKNYTFKRYRADLPERYYNKLQKIIENNSVWSLKDFYYKRSSGYYTFYMKEGKYFHSIKIEYGVPLTGTNAKYMEIIRVMTGLAKLILEE